MTNQHPITLPPELVQQWLEKARREIGTIGYNPMETFHYGATQAARWGADQQLAEDAKWLDQHALDAPHLKITPVGESLKEAMRPKSPSLKEQALEVVTGLEKRWDLQCDLACLRRALEALPND